MTDEPMTDPADLPADQPEDEVLDPALAAAVLEIEAHAAESGWDQQGRLFALVPTAALVAAEPELARAMGLDAASAEGSFTPVEQELAPGQVVEEVLGSIMWPDGVAGCAAIVERYVLPPGADADIPEDAEQAQAYAAAHPDRQEVRMVAGVTRAGATYCALRLRAHDDEQSVVGGVDLVPELLEMLQATLDNEDEESGT
ncbi:PPA1309 family protein [Nocardioides dubius]|uniref:PPA1309 family protein n=1 Tax=Nocardioides dubius TaxID=317019 RepID=A0ABP4EK24_9ACTN